MAGDLERTSDTNADWQLHDAVTLRPWIYDYTFAT